ncbi:MAG: FG-GAP-like repeat-containing protein [Planctomycetota bacterium]
MKITPLACLLAAAPLALSQSPTGNTVHPITTTADGVQTVYAADLDDDGHVDVMSASPFDNTVAWYANDGAGNFGPPQVVDSAALGVQSVYAADLDGDGDLDLLSASRINDTVAMYENLGAGAFGAATAISTAADGAVSVFAADLDGDGDLDVLAASFFDHTIQWFENLGGGSFGPRATISAAALGANSVYAADLDGDGDADVLSASFLDGKVAWYENLGGGAFAAEQVLTSTAPGAISVYAADLDGDGDREVLAASLHDDTVSSFENLGAGSFGPRQAVTATADGARSVYAGDVDGDGDLDVLAASSFDNAIGWFANDGAGSFGPRQVLTAGAMSARSVFAADVDDDGDLDVLSASAHDDTVAWYENPTPPAPAEASVPVYLVLGDSLMLSAAFTETFTNALNHPTYTNTPRSPLQMIWNPDSGAVETYDAHQNSHGNGTIGLPTGNIAAGPDFSLSQLLEARHPTEGFVLVKRAAVSSTLSVFGVPYSQGSHTAGRWSENVGGENWDGFVDDFDDCRAYLENVRNKQMDVRGIFVSLGTNDMAVPGGGDAFSADLEPFVAELRAAFGTGAEASRTPVVWIRPQPATSVSIPAEVVKVRDALTARASADRSFYALDIDGLAQFFDGIHLAPDSTVTLGERMDAALERFAQPVAPVGSGCAGLALSSTDRMRIGETWTAVVDNVEPLSPFALFFLGSDARPFPIPLGPSCSALIELDLGYFPVLAPFGAARLVLPLPNDGALLGAKLAVQSTARSTSPSAWGNFALSNGLLGSIGY